MEDQGLSSELHIAALLGDSNLPTGGFVASAGLEAATAHSLLAEKQSVGSGNDLEGDALPAIRGPQSAQARALQAFIDDSLGSYDLLVSPVIRAMADVMSTVTASARPEVLDDCVARFVEADNRLHSQMPNHVNRRASIAQGAALLTLYAKSFSGSSMQEMSEAWKEVAPKEDLHWRLRVRHRRAALIAAVKASIRSGKAPGHLAVVWGLFAFALDLPRERCVELHLFLQARAMLSSAVRLNLVGPYLAHQLLLFDVEHVLRRIRRQPNSISKAEAQTEMSSEAANPSHDQWSWDWGDDGLDYTTSTWPLLELAQGRHDQLHSRLFNS